MRGVAAKEISKTFQTKQQAIDYAYSEGFVVRIGDVFYRKNDRALAILLEKRNTLLVICR